MFSSIVTCKYYERECVHLALEKVISRVSWDIVRLGIFKFSEGTVI